MTTRRRKRWLGISMWLGYAAMWVGLALWWGAVRASERCDEVVRTDARSVVGIEDSEYSSAIAAARLHVRAMMIERDVPGAAVAVFADGRLVWSEAFGFADVESRTPATPASRFRVGSVSKLFTAAAMGRLIDQGRLDPEASVRTYVPSFPDKGASITPRLLALHRAGIRSYRDDLEAINHARYDSVVASLEKFADDPLVSAPGEQFLYTNYGYVLLSAAIEGAAGEPFLNLVQREVFAPLGMERSMAEDAGQEIPDAVSCYDHETPFSPDGSRVRSPANDFSCKWASGGFRSTAEDVARFGAGHVDGSRFLSDATRRMLLQPVSGLPPLGGYGMGWMSASDLHLRRACFHFGASSGGTALLAVYPRHRVSIAIVANLGHAKFPFNRIMGVANPFLPDPGFWVRLVTACVLVLFGAVVARRWRRVAGTGGVGPG